MHGGFWLWVLHARTRLRPTDASELGLSRHFRGCRSCLAAQGGAKVAAAVKAIDPRRLIAQPAEWPPLSQCGVTNFGATASPPDINATSAGTRARRGVLAYDESGGLRGGHGSLADYRASCVTTKPQQPRV